jgi:uncharacterized protein YwgA
MHRTDASAVWLKAILGAEPESYLRYRSRVQKLVFLLQQSVDTELAKTRFDFEPGEYGPSSQGVHRLLDRLVRRGVIGEREYETEDGLIQYEYSLHEDEPVAHDPEVAAALTEVASDLVSKWGSRDLQELVDHTMTRYPSMIQSRRRFRA